MSQISKNTVSAENQLKSNEYIKFTNPDNKGLRVLFLGNSITLHGVKHEIGWHNAWGMAASAEENDYVHILMKYICDIEPESAFCVCQGSKWEVNYLDNIDFYNEYKSARDFSADIIIVRLIENCKVHNFNATKFKKEIMNFVSYLSGDNSSKVIFTTSFWHHPGDSAVKELAEENNCQIADISDLGDDKEMMAIGLFEHEGVSIHPGDKGMKCIADRIFEKLKIVL